jgi:hypothetical protein
MPEELEVPTEHLHESMEEKAHEASEKWVSRVALSAAILSVLAAITAMLAGDHANEAMIEQLQASDQWAYYQSKGIKATVLDSKMEVLEAQGKTPNPKDEEKLTAYKQDQAGIKDTADEKETVAADHLRKHNKMARGVTAFQIAIALSAISVLTKRKALWYCSLALGAAGVGFLIAGLV